MRGIVRLAKELGVSTATVSRALNGKPDVKADTRRAVLEAARRLGYVPNQAARALAQGSTRSVGFMIDLDRENAPSREYFFTGVFDGVQSVLSQHGLDLLVLPRPTKEDALAFLQRHVARGAFDGMILSATQQVDSRIDLLESAGVPFVTLGRSSSGSKYPWIDMDFEGVAASVVDRLVKQGHRRIAVTLPDGDINFGPVFKNAYKEALQRNGIPFDPCLVFVTRRNEEAGYELVDRMRAVSSPPTAVLLIYEIAAIGIYRRLGEIGAVPGIDLAIIGFRDEPTIRFVAPSLTCFSACLKDLGEHLAFALLGSMPNRVGHSRQNMVQKLRPLTLRPGESG
jgi:DNA-binding LacI/PurR family transcriptional regulator